MKAERDEQLSQPLSPGALLSWDEYAYIVNRELDDDLKAVPPRRRGRPAISTEILQEAARVYSGAYEKGEPPTQAVREHFNLKRANAARYVWLCRQKGLLPPTTQGRASGLQPRKPEEDPS